jgi:Putative amidoligase enzyme
MKLVSPTLTVYPGSIWRETVKEVWNYLLDHYHVIGDVYFGNHVHISMWPSITLSEVKRIAQAGILFENAIEALVPSRRGHPDAKSNWLHSSNLAMFGYIHHQCINRIELAIGTDDANFMHYGNEMDQLMQKYDEADDEFVWNFKNFTLEQEIEFRKPDSSTSYRHALSWAEFTLCFIRAAIESPWRVQRRPSNAGLLRSFLHRYTVPWLLDECEFLPSIWAGVDSTATLEPRLSFGRHATEVQIQRESAALLETMIDQRRWYLRIASNEPGLIE